MTMPIEFDVTTPIDRPAAEVFAFVTDPSALPLWDPRVVETRVEGRPLREGSRIVEVRRVGPRRLEQTVAVSAHEPPRRFGLRIVEGPFPVHAEFEFEPHGGGTLLRLRAHGTARGPRMLAPLVRAVARRQMRAQHERLKRVLESGAAAAGERRDVSRALP